MLIGVRTDLPDIIVHLEPAATIPAKEREEEN